MHRKKTVQEPYLEQRPLYYDLSIRASRDVLQSGPITVVTRARMIILISGRNIAMEFT